MSRGKVVTTYTDNVSVPGWSGVGYIVINPETGDGGYYISGGENGGQFDIDKLNKVSNLINIGVIIVNYFVLPGSSGVDNLIKQLCLTQFDIQQLKNSSQALVASALMDLDMGSVTDRIATFVTETAFLMLGRIAITMHIMNKVLGQGDGSCH